MVRGYVVIAYTEKARALLRKFNKKDKNATVTYTEENDRAVLKIELKSLILYMMKKSGAEIKPAYIIDTLEKNGFDKFEKGKDYEVEFLE